MNVHTVTLFFTDAADAEWFAKCAAASVKTHARLDPCRAGIMQDSISKAFSVETSAHVVEPLPPAPLKCESCGSTESDVVETTCPYAADVNNDPTVPAVLCPSCYQGRCDDI